MAIEITLRDMYVKGTDTIILDGALGDKFLGMSGAEKESLIKNLETVSFKNFYISSTRKI